MAPDNSSDGVRGGTRELASAVLSRGKERREDSGLVRARFITERKDFSDRAPYMLEAYFMLVYADKGNALELRNSA